MVIYISLLICLVGLLAYALSANPKIARLGELSFFAGLLAFLITSVPKMAELLK